jgi:hypothetical protein
MNERNKIMARKVFYSFHYKPDCTRVALIRNMGVVEGNRSLTDNDWETIANSGDSAIKRWIDDQLSGRSCTIVLIGENTAKRKWIDYEIETSWNNGKGLLGVYIHNLKNLQGKQCNKGANPFSHFSIGQNQRPMTRIVKTYEPPYSDSKDVYKYINNYLADWIEEAINIRGGF